MDDATRVAPLSDVPEDGTLLFTVRDAAGEELEAILVGLADGVAAYENHCQHWTDVSLDSGDGAPVRGGELLCARHGATFDPADGFCTHGPCEGAYLDAIDVAVEEGTVYLVDPAYEFAGLGGQTRDPVDLSTSGDRNIGF